MSCLLSPLSNFEVSPLCASLWCARCNALRQSGGGGHIVHTRAWSRRETNSNLLLHLSVLWMLTYVDGIETTQGAIKIRWKDLGENVTQLSLHPGNGGIPALLSLGLLQVGVLYLLGGRLRDLSHSPLQGLHHHHEDCHGPEDDQEVFPKQAECLGRNRVQRRGQDEVQSQVRRAERLRSRLDTRSRILLVIFPYPSTMVPWKLNLCLFEFFIGDTGPSSYSYNRRKHKNNIDSETNTFIGFYVSLFVDLKLSVQTLWSIKKSRKTTRNAKWKTLRSVLSGREKKTVTCFLILWYRHLKDIAPLSQWCGAALSRGSEGRPSRDISAGECQGRPVSATRVCQRPESSAEWVWG